VTAIAERQTATEPAPTMLVTEATVVDVQRLSPAYVRITFGGSGIRDLGTGPSFDCRFKVVLPGPTGALPVWDGVDPLAWRVAWETMPEGERAPMRTYTIREVRTGLDGRAVALVADFVVHEGAPEDLGPACRWALAARPGDVVHLVGPHRLGPHAYGGVEFDPGTQRDVLLVGDETALPAIARILADSDPGLSGRAFVEVPSAADRLQLPTHPGIGVSWVVRDGAAQGRRLLATVRQHLGLPPVDAAATTTAEPELPSSLDVEVWETPRYSSAGEDLEVQLHAAAGTSLPGTYAWIAGESWLVKTLRRALVSELGVARAQVAFMGYWREGVAMRS
jgi:NADPH-dependent ferric siderophore reductase